jgi:membrane fusion protein (multidrug efflux system)
VDPNTRAVTARAQFANPGERIKPGMLLRVGVVQSTRQAMAVPEAAVLFEGDAAFVYVVGPGGGGGGPRASAGARPTGAQGSGGGRPGGLAAQRRPVQVGARQDGLVEIMGGLRVGERLVAEGLNRVTPNQPIRIAGGPGALTGGGAGGAGQGAGTGGAAR